MGAIADRLLGSRGAAAVFATATGHRLRILAYHDVADDHVFRAQMEWLSEHYAPAPMDEVLTAFRGGSSLPRRSVWVTFDDGHPSVVEVAQPTLDRLGIRATLFVCPGLIASRTARWWEVVEQALACGLRPQVGGRDWHTTALVTYLKSVPDSCRREVVAMLDQAVSKRTGAPPLGQQLTETQLRSWLSAGHTIGNHTWDHPCLDQCAALEQTRQIAKADRWFEDFGVGVHRVFAYPNGDWTNVAEATLVERAYDAAVLFDHRLSSVRSSPLRISRLRVAADSTPHRFRAIVAGGNPLLYALRCRVTARSERAARLPRHSRDQDRASTAS